MFPRFSSRADPPASLHAVSLGIMAVQDAGAGVAEAAMEEGGDKRS